MDSDEERESTGMAADVPLQEQQLQDLEAPMSCGRRTRSTAGTKRSMSPDAMHMDTDLDVRLQRLPVYCCRCVTGFLWYSVACLPPTAEHGKISHVQH